jgi:hypothetical protein
MTKVIPRIYLGLARQAFILLCVILVLSHSRSHVQASQTAAPPDLLDSQAYPEDLVKDLPDDDAAGDCWKDELNGNNLDWNKDATTPFVKYQYRFRNTCQKPITCTLIIASGTKLRDPNAAKGIPLRPQKEMLTSVAPSRSNRVRNRLSILMRRWL